MKQTLFYLAAAAALLTAFSCRKNASPETVSDVPTEALTVNISVPEENQTKSEYTARKDNQISSVQIFVFNAQNLLETDLFKSITPVDNSTSVTVNTMTGTKTVYALLNHSRLYKTQGVYSLTDFEAELTNLSENTPTKLVMSGKNTITVGEYDKNKNSSQTPQAMGIWVKRLASMVVLENITVDFNGTSLEGASFQVEDIYLKNVVGVSRLGTTATANSANSAFGILEPTDATLESASNWYNKQTKQASGAPDVVSDTWTKVCTVASPASPTNLGRCLFAYPNKTTTDSHGDTWTPRMTRVVIKAHVKKAAVSIDKPTYYVFDLPVLEANKVYSIQNVNITMLGKDNDDKDDNIQAGRITPAITVDPWTGTVNLQYEF